METRRQFSKHIVSILIIIMTAIIFASCSSAEASFPTGSVMSVIYNAKTGDFQMNDSAQWGISADTLVPELSGLDNVKLNDSTQRYIQYSDGTYGAKPMGETHFSDTKILYQAGYSFSKDGKLVFGNYDASGKQNYDKETLKKELLRLALLFEKNSKDKLASVSEIKEEIEKDGYAYGDWYWLGNQTMVEIANTDSTLTILIFGPDGVQQRLEEFKKMTAYKKAH